MGAKGAFASEDPAFSPDLDLCQAWRINVLDQVESSHSAPLSSLLGAAGPLTRSYRASTSSEPRYHVARRSLVVAILYEEDGQRARLPACSSAAQPAAVHHAWRSMIASQLGGAWRGWPCQRRYIECCRLESRLTFSISFSSSQTKRYMSRPSRVRYRMTSSVDYLARHGSLV